MYLGLQRVRICVFRVAKSAYFCSLGYKECVFVYLGLQSVRICVFRVAKSAYLCI